MDDVQNAKEQTAQKLGISIDELSYITPELLRDFRENAREIDGSDGDHTGKARPRQKGIGLGGWGTFGNSIVFDSGPGGKTYWRQGPKGTPNYGCSTAVPWSAGKDWTKYIRPQGQCTDGKRWFFLGNYPGP